MLYKMGCKYNLLSLLTWADIGISYGVHRFKILTWKKGQISIAYSCHASWFSEAGLSVYLGLAYYSCKTSSTVKLFDESYPFQSIRIMSTQWSCFINGSSTSICWQMSHCSPWQGMGEKSFIVCHVSFSVLINEWETHQQIKARCGW